MSARPGACPRRTGSPGPAPGGKALLAKGARSRQHSRRGAGFVLLFLGDHVIGAQRIDPRPGALRQLQLFLLGGDVQVTLCALPQKSVVPMRAGVVQLNMAR